MREKYETKITFIDVSLEMISIVRFFSHCVFHYRIFERLLKLEQKARNYHFIVVFKSFSKLSMQSSVVCCNNSSLSKERRQATKSN